MNDPARQSYETLARLLRYSADGPPDLKGRSEEEWQGVVAQAELHRVQGLLFHRLGRLPATAIPPAAVMERLHSAALATGFRNTLLLHELGAAVARLGEAGLPVLVLKGAHLAEAVYDNAALRTMDDADLLVRREDLSRTETILRGLGFTSRESGPVPSFPHHLPPFEKAGKAVLEVHWTIPPADLFRIDIDGIFLRARRISIGGAQAGVMCPEDLLLHLCIHASVHHRFGLGLRALCDIAETLKRHAGELEWGGLAARSREWGCSRAVFLTLLAAQDIVGAEVPKEALDGLRPRDFDPLLAEWAAEQCFRRGDELWKEESISPRMARAWAAPTLRARASGLLQLAFPPPGAVAAIYGVEARWPQLSLAYARRIGDLLFRRGAAVARMAGGSPTAKLSARVLSQLVDEQPEEDLT